jgi:FixJ family two-component response regulator
VDRSSSDLRGLAVADNDGFLWDALSVVFAEAGFRIDLFATSDSFLLATEQMKPHCVILDADLTPHSGLDVLAALGRDYPAPVFLTSAHADIPMAVAAIKGGAYDLIEKPFSASAAIERVLAAMSDSRPAGVARWRRLALSAGLTPRELDVLHQIVAGASNKLAGRLLTISPRTVEVHRSRLMEKLGARNTADLMRIVLS